MTTCNAAICDNGKAVVLVADKMIGMGYVESELEISRMRPIHSEWWMLFAGDDITPVFDIVNYAKSRLGQKDPATKFILARTWDPGKSAPARGTTACSRTKMSPSRIQTIEQRACNPHSGASGVCSPVPDYPIATVLKTTNCMGSR
ncbi:MAG TPA: hypothetical protein VGF88_16690 [Acidobacteriaceae bacterium]|jgi:hypothetical protein